MTPDGVRLAYARAGQGPPLVKVGTWLTHLEQDWTSPVWRPWLDQLSRFHTLYRYDPRGCGLSDWDVAAISIEALVSDLETMVDALGLQQFALMGMSQGGCVAIIYAARHPERVTQLVIYGGYMTGVGRRLRSPLEQEEDEVFSRMLKLAWADHNPIYKQILSMGLLPEGTAEQIGWLNDLQMASTSAENAQRLHEVYKQVDVSDLAGTLSPPTLVLHAQQDAAVSFEDGRLLATRITGASFAPLGSKNHILLPSEPAWQQFWEEFYRFLGVTPADEPDPAQGQPAPDPFTQLTNRDRDTLALLSKGYRNEEIARMLVLSPKTVRNYVSRLYDKLGVSSRGQLIVMGRKAGFNHLK